MDALARSAQRIDRSIATLRAEVAAPPKPPPPAALAKLDARVGALRDPVNALRDATNDNSTVDELHNLQRAHLATEGLLTDAKLRLRCFGVSAAPPAASATAPVEPRRRATRRSRWRGPHSHRRARPARRFLGASDVPASPGFDIDLDAPGTTATSSSAPKRRPPPPAAPAEPLISFGSPTPSAPPARGHRRRAAIAGARRRGDAGHGARPAQLAAGRRRRAAAAAAAASGVYVCTDHVPAAAAAAAAQDGNFFPQASALSEEELAAAPAYLLQQLGMESVGAINAKLTAVNERVAERALFEDDLSGVVGLDDLRALLRVDPARTRTFALLMMHCDRFAAGAEQELGAAAQLSLSHWTVSLSPLQ